MTDGEERPQNDFDLPEGMTVYYLGLLRRGPAWTPEVTPATEQLQADHLAHIGRMDESGALLMAGPFLDGGDLRGVFQPPAPNPQPLFIVLLDILC